jgi:hypothetical protein
LGTVGNTKVLINPYDIKQLVPKIQELEKMFKSVDVNSIQPVSTIMKSADLLPIKMYDVLTAEPNRLPDKSNINEMQR